MIYPSNFEQRVGFDRIREQIVDMCSTSSARAVIAAEGFLRSPSKIEERLELADEMRLVISMEPGAEIGEGEELRPIVEKIAVEGSYLVAEECATLLKAIRSAAAIVNFITTRREGNYPRLKALTRGVEIFPELQRALERVIDDKGEVRSSASEELSVLRRAIRDHEGQVAKRLQQVLQRAKSSGIVDADAMISIRDGHAVIPVSAANKRKIAGFIHDESATGRTFYIEPVEVVELNNELRELEYEEKREVVRILTELTALLRSEVAGLERIDTYLTHIDVLRAKARWALANGAVRPIISTEGRLLLRKARHPLLQQTLRSQQKEIVPLDMELNSERRILVISGPNAGGKSVCLKTTGILQYMVQCGFLVTALENSEFPIFDSLMIDIGDQQSIENDLSTYSSHLVNMKTMLEEVSERVMILIDEFGSGTEPTIGGAISESILERFVERRCYGVITTHYANIKYFASRNDGVANGAMTFDVRNIVPLFSLEMGKPGSSFAIEVARKIGLSEDIVRSAMDKAGEDHINLEKQLREIARDRRYWAEKRDRIRLTDRKVEQLEQTYTDRLQSIKDERREIIERARREAEEMVAEARRTIENTIRTIRESQADKELTRLARRELESFVEGGAEAKSKSSDERIEREMERLARRRERRERRAEERERQGGVVEQRAVEVAPQIVEVGSKVKLEGQDIPGVVKMIKGKKAQVAFGEMLIMVDVARLRCVSSAEYRQATRPVAARTVVSVDVRERKLNFKDHIDVRGMRAAEALEAVEDLVDDALMVGVSTVTILHGKGTGALKEEIRRYLRSVKDVASVADDHADRGGAGITIVTFKM
ncbi:MAG: endonuclease MutS2 [Rikenellaceae bacterium]|nr:endonuclease MutS2 [Rikenellaceae bacterium]